MDERNETKLLSIPRGVPGLSPLSLDMTEIYNSEKRLKDVAFVTPETALELMSVFNDSCNTATKYVAWIEYEILQAEKHYDMAVATVILDKAPEAFQKIKDTGIKFNEDFRKALIARDPECQLRYDTLSALKAAKALLENKAKSFERAYFSCRYIASKKDTVSAAPNLSGVLNQTEYTNFMGERK